MKRTPNCPRCKSNANVVRLVCGFRCAFCGARFFDYDLNKNQQKLNIK